MREFAELTPRGQLRRLRRLTAGTLASYGVRPRRLTLLAHMENATFRVDADDGERYVFRLHRDSGSPFHPVRTEDEVRSEMQWLAALCRETNLAVPEPVPAVDGSLVRTAAADGVPGSRICVLLRWSDGQFRSGGLTPDHLERVGRFIARLHEHAASFTPPPGFTRPQIGDLTPEAVAYIDGAVREQGGEPAGALVERTLGAVAEARDALGTGPDVYGLIHADLHQENYLFNGGNVIAIDFDDCGWGHFAYDLTVTLSELRNRTDFPDLRAGLLRGYRSVRPFPTEHEGHTETFHGLRLVQLMLWFYERRDQPGFEDWAEEMREGLEELDAFAPAGASIARD